MYMADDEQGRPSFGKAASFELSASEGRIMIKLFYRKNRKGQPLQSPKLDGLEGKMSTYRLFRLKQSRPGRIFCSMR